MSDIWRRDGERCVWCGSRPWEHDRTVEHLLPRSRGGTSDDHNLLPACRTCNRARRSQSAAAYARRRGDDGRPVQVDLLVRGLERLVRQGTAAERRYGARQAKVLLDWRRSEQSMVAHAARLD